MNIPNSVLIMGDKLIRTLSTQLQTTTQQQRHIAQTILIFIIKIMNETDTIKLQCQCVFLVSCKYLHHIFYCINNFYITIMRDLSVCPYLINSLWT